MLVATIWQHMNMTMIYQCAVRKKTENKLGKNSLIIDTPFICDGIFLMRLCLL